MVVGDGGVVGGYYGVVDDNDTMVNLVDVDPNIDDKEEEKVER